MCSATVHGFEVEKVNIGTTSITNPTFFLEYGGSVYGNTISLDYQGNIYTSGNSVRHITVTSDSAGVIYLTSIGLSYPSTLQHISMAVTVHIAG